MQRVYGQKIYDKKVTEQADKFYQMVMKQKIEGEYQRIDGLWAERRRLVAEVRETKRKERIKVGAKINRLKVKVAKVACEIEEVRAHGVGLRAQIEVIDQEYKYERWKVD